MIYIIITACLQKCVKEKEGIRRYAEPFLSTNKLLLARYKPQFKNGSQSRKLVED